MLEEAKTKWRFEEVARQPLPTFAEPMNLYNAERDPLWKTAYKSMFAAPIRLGENIAELYPEVKNARVQIEKLREKGGEYARIADEMEIEVGKNPTAAQVIGNVLGTALWLAPVGIVRGLKAAPLLRTFLNSGLAGVAYGTTDAIGEGKKWEEVATRGITSGLIAAPLGMATAGIYKYGIKLPIKKAMLKMPETVKRGLYPVISRLRSMGVISQQLADDFEKISIEAKVQVGDDIEKLIKVGFVETPTLVPFKKKAPVITKDMAWRGENSVLDVLEGKTNIKNADPIVQKAAKVGRQVYEGVATSADEAGLLIGKRNFYFTHHTPDAKVVILKPSEQVALNAAKTVVERESIHLQSKVKESLRRDIIENMVYKQGAFNTVESAANFLDGWADYVVKGGRITEKSRPFLDWIIKTGQAKSLKDAENKAFVDFIRRPSPRIPAFGPLEKSRKLNIPIYDPDPRRVLPAYILGSHARIEAAKVFGPTNEVLNQAIRKVSKAQGFEVAKEVDSLVRTITSQVERAPAREQLSVTLRMLQTPKLAFGQILNLGQNLNTLLGSDLGSLAYGLQQVFTDKGMMRAIKSGSAIQSVLQRELAYYGGGLNFANKILKYSGFTWTEMFNRTVTANSFYRYAEKTFSKLQKNPTNKFLRWRLEELNIVPDEALTRGKLVEKELLRAANKGTTMTQFLSDPLYLPAWASSPEGKVFFQFKNFAYNQARFVKNQLFNKQIPISRKIRTVAILGLAFPISGEVLGNIRSMLTGEKRPTKAWDRYWSNIAMSGTFGLWLDFMQSATYGKVSEFIGGPTVASVADLTEGFIKSIEKGEVTSGFLKSALRQTGVLRPVANYLIPSKKKNMGQWWEFWDNL